MKKLLATLLLGAALTVGALPAAAAGTDGTVTMQPEGDRAAVTLSVPEGADQDATALRLSFQVEGGDAAASFLFDEELTATVQQYRFDAATGVLTLYLAGADPLLQEGSAELGELCLSAGRGATATVRVVEDSLELVNAAYSKAGVTHATGAEVTLTVPGSNPAPEQTPTPETQPEQTPAPEVQPEGTPSPTPAPGGQATPAPSGGNGQSSTTQSGGKAQGSSNAGNTPTPTPVVSTTPVSTAAPGGSAPAAATTQGGKGVTTGKGGSKATPAPSASPEPSATPTASATPAPSATPTATPATQTAETTETAQPLQEGNGGLPLPLVIAAAVVLAALLGVGIVRLRNR